MFEPELHSHSHLSSYSRNFEVLYVPAQVDWNIFNWKMGTGLIYHYIPIYSTSNIVLLIYRTDKYLCRPFDRGCTSFLLLYNGLTVFHRLALDRIVLIWLASSKVALDKNSNCELYLPHKGMILPLLLTIITYSPSGPTETNKTTWQVCLMGIRMTDWFLNDLWLYI